MVSSSSLTNYETITKLPYNQTSIKQQNDNNNHGSNSLYRNPSQPNQRSTSIKYQQIPLQQQQQQQHYYPNNSYLNKQFKFSTTNDPADFYFRSLLRYVRSGNLDNYFEKLEFILKQCPTICQKLASSSSSTNNNNTTSSSTNASTTGIASATSTTGTTSCINGVPPMSPTTNLLMQHLHINNSSSNHHHHHHSHSHGHGQCCIKLNERSRSALIALLILIIENYYNRNKLKKLDDNIQLPQLNTDLLGYLLIIFENLPHLKWIDDQQLASCNFKNSKYFLFKCILFI